MVDYIGKLFDKIERKHEVFSYFSNFLGILDRYYCISVESKSCKTDFSKDK